MFVKLKFPGEVFIPDLQYHSLFTIIGCYDIRAYLTQAIIMKFEILTDKQFGEEYIILPDSP